MSRYDFAYNNSDNDSKNSDNSTNNDGLSNSDDANEYDDDLVYIAGMMVNDTQLMPTPYHT